MAQTIGTAEVVLEFDGKKITGELQQVESKIKNVGNSAGSGFSGKWAAAMGVISGATQAAFNKVSSVISGAMDSAIRRVDIMNNFPKVMDSLGFSSKEAEKSIQSMSDHLDGLPTSLQDMTSNVQNLAATMGNLNSGTVNATSVGLAFNDMMLAGGQGTQVATNAFTQYNQMLAAGKVDQQAWNSVVNAAPGQMKQLSQTLLGANANQKDLYEAMKNGTVTFDDMNKAIVQLDQEGGKGFASFNEQAKSATQGIGTSIENLKNSLTKVVGAALNGDDMTKPLNQLIDRFSELAPNLITAVSNAFMKVASAIPKFITPVLKGIVDAIPGIIDGVTELVQNIADELPKQIPIIIEGIKALMDAVIKNLPTILTALTQIVVEIALALTSPENITAMINGFVQLFMALTQAIPQIVEALTTALPQIIDNLVAILTNPEMIMKLIAAGVQLFIALVTGLFQVAGTLIGKVGELLGNVIGKVGEFVGNMASKAIEAGKGFFSGIVDNIKNLPSNIGKTISNVVQKVGNFASNVINKAKEIGSGFINNIMNFFKDLPGNIWNTLLSVITNVGNFAIDMANKAKEAGQDVFNAIVDKIGEIPGKMLELGKNIVEGLWNGISDMVSWIGEKIKGFGEGILNGLKDFFGIHSPSKVMADVVGSNLAKGVIEGVNKEKGNAKKSATELAKVYVSAAKSKVTELRQANKISEAQEIDYWQQIVKTVKKGTSAYKTAVNKLTQAKNTLRSDVAKLTSTYASDVAKVQSKLADDIAAVNAQLEKDIQSLRDQYTSAVASRASSIMGQVGLFSAVSLSKGVDSSKLIENLQGQVEAYREWDETLNVLRRRVGSGALLEELENQGVSSLNTLNAIKDMSDEELQTYIDLYNQKAIIAKNRATVENQELLATVNAQISALRTQATQQIEELKTAANQEIKELTAQYKTDLKALGVTTRKQSKQVGTQIANGIKDGLDEQMPKIQAELQKQVAAMVNSVKKQLKIKSPSRVFAEIGSYMAQGLGVGWQDEFKAVSSDITDTLPSANGWSGSLTAMFEDAPAPSGGGGVTVENQVFNIASGFDYRDVERQVMEGLRRAA